MSHPRANRVVRSRPFDGAPAAALDGGAPVSRLVLAALVTAVLLLAAGTARAQGPEIGVSYEASFHSHYVWRGIVLTDGPVMQPSITATVGNFAVNTWGNFELDDVNGAEDDFTELDVTLTYSVPLEGPVSVDVGWIEYTFPNIGLPGTREVYVSLGFGGVVSPTLNIYYDFDEIEDFYADFGIEYSKEFGSGWSWSLGLTAGYAGDDWAAIAAGGTDGGLFEGIAKLGLGYEKGAFAFGAYVAYLDSLDEDALPEQPTDTFGGVSFGWSF